MSENKVPSSVDQNVAGDDNIQVAGDNNTIQQEITDFITKEPENGAVGQKKHALQQNPRTDPPVSFPQKSASSFVNQTISGNNNIQIAGNNNFIQRIIKLFQFDTEAQRAQRNRRAMLELVKNTWVKGVLENSLYAEILIDLGLEATPNAVKRPWDVQVQMPKQENRRLPTGTSLAHVFDALNGTMLILGEPGSGKTTMLLELARDKIARAEKHPDFHIPVVFNLSSWVNPKQPLATWLVVELTTKYYVSSKIASSWVENDELLLLLDGLDEVRSELRDDCVEAINSFRNDHGLMPIVVCSRISDYAVLNKKLNLQGAVLLQPLTPAQIDEYFKRAGPQLATVREVLQQDSVLLELACQPLMLGIITLGYQNVSPRVITSSKHFSDREARRKHLFDIYIQQMFNRVTRTKNNTYPPELTRHCLAWLAQKMDKQRQSIFFLERISPQWLANSFQNKTYQFLLIFWRILTSGVTGGLVFGLIDKVSDKPIWNWVVGLLAGLALGALFALPSTQRTPDHYAAYAKPVEVLRWSWKAVGKYMADELINGLIVGFLMGIVFSMTTGAWEALWIWTAVVLSLKIIGGIILLPNYGLESADLETRMIPNQGILQSLINAVIVFSFGGALIWILVGLVVSYFSDTTVGLIIGLAGGLLYGVIYGVDFCGQPVYAHYVLRFLFYSDGHMPLNYVAFLDYCAERIFLRKVGGGYIFVHRLLMEHFAAMYSVSDK